MKGYTSDASCSFILSHYFQQKASLQSLVSITARIRFFAECHVPSVFFRTLVKEALCRVLNKKHSEKKTLGKEASLPSVKNTRQRRPLPSVFDTRQSSFSKHILKL
jgi:hypothetical protein